MPRNSSGTYTLPAGNPVVPNTLIDTNWANPTMSDLGAAITDSLDRFGRGGMLAQLKLADGTVTQPAFAFNAESSTGLYRPGAGSMNVAVLGVSIASFQTAAITFGVVPKFAAAPTVAADLTNKAYVDGLVATGPYLPLAGGTMTGAILHIPGALGAPGMAFAGDANTGIWNPGADIVEIARGGTPAVRFNGVGAAFGGLTATDSAGYAGPVIDNPGGGYFRQNSLPANYLALGVLAGVASIVAGFNGPLTFASNSLERGRFEAGGGFLVGTTANAGNRLAVFGGRANIEVVLKSTVASGGAGQSTLYFGNSGTDGQGWVNYDHAANFMSFGVSAGERARIETTGSYFVGTTSLTSDYSGANTISGVRGNSAGKIGSVIAQGFGTTNAAKIEMFGGDGVNEVGLLTAGAATRMSFYTGSPVLERLRISAAGIITEQSSGIEIGYKDIPRVDQAGGSAAIGIRARMQGLTSAATYTVPSGVFGAGNAFSIVNFNAGAVTIAQGAGLTMHLAGTATTGNRTLAGNGTATVWFSGAAECWISGAGVT